ncbi:MAG: ferritin-like domain-containing protein [Methylococcaceae bacterium]|nr:ferritin-like domain-containing protein [Methylococcaceae bacterium]
MQQTTQDKSLGNSAGNLDMLSDIKTLRARARKDIEQGAVTTGYAADRNAVVTLLNEALATELGGEPDFSPDGLSERSHAEYVAGDTLNAMIKEDLIAERIAIESYREMIAYLGDADPTTQKMLKEILAMEEEHAEDLASILTNHTEPK